MRHVYIVAYDIADAKRWQRVYKIMLGVGDHVQYSVFRCELNERELAELRVKLRAAIHHTEDRVLIGALGPVEGRGAEAIETLGKPHVFRQARAIVI